MFPKSKLLTILYTTAFAQAQLFFHSAQIPLDVNDNKIPNSCDCTGVPASQDPAVYICGDPRLGPVELPRKFPLLDIVSTYDRFGGVKPATYINTWWDSSLPYNYMGIKGGWRYPPKDGFLFGPDNVTVQAYSSLEVGTVLDRFGSETGKYLAAADAPFNQRALPPSNLNTGSNPDYPADYHVYQVVKRLPVLAGVIAPGFGQPGLGAQFFVGGLAKDNKGTVLTALDQGYIVRVNKTQFLAPGDPSYDPSKRCGLD